MAVAIKAFLANAFRFLFLEPSRVEYYCFDGQREFLVIHYSPRNYVPFLKKQVVCEQDVANSQEATLEAKAIALEKQGASLYRRERLTFQEFDKLSADHPVLKNNSWVKDRQEMIRSGISRR